ncbi:MAG: hypothetical protein Q9187_005745 [Circinaria calcarea]
MPASSEFENAAAAVKKFSKDPPNEVKLEGKAKYNAWKKVNDAKVTPAEAQKKYVELYKKIKSDYE